MPEDAIAAEIELDAVAAADAAAAAAGASGLSPGRLALRRLRRDRNALVFGAIFVLLIAACVAAPLWANHVANRGPDDQPGSSETVTVDGEERTILGEFSGPNAGIPIGPTWKGEYFLGADSRGRDVMVRLLYGGRNSLMIGVSAALVTIVFGLILGILSGYLRGFTDTVITRGMDIIWAYPAVLLGIALGTAFALGGLQIGPITISGDSLFLPVLVISVIYVPYFARPLRGQVLALREREFIEAARAQGMGNFRIMFSEILPNLLTTALVFFPLLVANAILLESALSFLGAGVRPPNPSWGTMIDEGVARIVTAPYLAIVPGLMVVLTVLSLNVFGEGVRDALDPRGKLRLKT
jgi:peptide/nickel transport system permease protein